MKHDRITLLVRSKSSFLTDKAFKKIHFFPFPAAVDVNVITAYKKIYHFQQQVNTAHAPTSTFHASPQSRCLTSLAAPY